MYRFFSEDGASYGLCKLFAGGNPVQNSSNIGKVASELKAIEERKKPGIFIGFIDDDKNTPKYFKKFKVVKKEKAGVIVKRLNNLFLIVLSPRVDEFLHTNATEIDLNLLRLSFSKNEGRFVSQMKTFGIERTANFNSLINELKQGNCSCFLALREAFDYIYSQK